MTEKLQGSASCFPSIEAKYGRPTGEWQQAVRDRMAEHPDAGHMQSAGWLKSEHGMGHGHAAALVGWVKQHPGG